MAIQTKQAPVRRQHRFTVREYQHMAEVGILGEDDRVELLGGEIIQMSAMGAKHAGCVTRLTRLLPPQVAGAALLRVQLPVAVPLYDEPEPDVALVRPREDDYDRSHPTPSDVLLVMEVADTSLAYDRRVKLPVYARAGIPEAWLLDLPGVGIERHNEPDRAAGVYRSVARVGRGESLASEAIPGLVLSVDEALGL